jgi:hypothetical protein
MLLIRISCLLSGAALLTVLILAHVNITNAQFALGPQMSYATGAYPFFVATGDFNSDNRKDIVVANSDSNTVSLLIGNGDGTFQTALSYSVGNRPIWLAVSDFNGDAKSDVAVTHYFGNDVGVLLGNGDGTFQSPVYYSTGSFAYSAAASDLNNDNKVDLVVVNYTCFLCNSTYSILLGNGNGTFQAALNYVTGGQGSQSHELADLNGDGKADLAVSSADSNNVNVSLGNGDGTFQSPTNYATALNPVAVTLAKLNGDDLFDLAVTTYFDNQVSVRIGNGDGTFQSSQGNNSGANPGQAASGDFDGDLIVDLAVVSITGNTVGVLLGNGNGTFQTPINFAVGSSPFSNAAADFNQDGKLDLAVANRSSNSISVFLNATPPRYTINLLYDSAKAHKLGSTIPIKFQVLNGGINISNEALTVHAAGISVAANNAPGQEASDSGNANPDSDFRYVSNEYIFNLSTAGLSATTTYKIYFTIGDNPEIYNVQFQIK